MTRIATNVDITLEIDANKIVNDAEYEVQSICESFMNDYDFTDVIESAKDNAVDEELLDNQLESWLKENPAVVVRVLLATLTWMEGRQRLVIDQAREMDQLKADNIKHRKSYS